MHRYLLLILLLFSSAFAQNYETLRVGRIDIIPENIEPGVSFNARQVRTRMVTKAGNFFSQQDFDDDLKMLAEEYDRVDPSLTFSGGQLNITLRIWFKPRIRHIIFCGNENVKSSKLMKKLDIDEGSLFEREEFVESFNELKTFYVKKGYFESELDYDIIPVEGCSEVDIRITVHEGTAGKIREIRFCGMSPCEERALSEILVTKKHFFLLSWLPGPRGCYHPDMIEHDRLQVLDYFQNEGYADAVVELCVEECSGGGIILVISIDKGQCYRVGHMNMCGNELFSKEVIWSKFTFGRGSPYSPSKVRETVQNITDLYGACGYVDASVELQVALRPDCPIYDVQLCIEEGERYHVGLVKVFGNSCTQSHVILHETLLTPGEVFNARKLKGTEQRLQNTGYFKNVNVYALQSEVYEYTASGQRYRDVFIEVDEADTGSIGLSLGFSSLEQLTGGFEISEQNFNILGLGRVPSYGPGALRGAGEYAHAKINVGDKTTSYLFQWTKPHFMHSPWIVGFDLEKNDNRIYSTGYEIKTYGGSVHATYILNDYLKTDLFYKAKHTRTAVGKTSSVALEIGQGENHGFLSSAGILFIYDSTDHPRRPTRGFRSSFLYELYGLGGNYEMMKFCYYNSKYFPIMRDTVFKMRADFQFMHKYGGMPTERVPMSERFFLGGETTVRGYQPFIIGPLFDDFQPRGGLSSALFSEEIQYTLCKCPFIDLFAFVDGGSVALEEFTIKNLAASVGFGTRMEVMKNTPMMFGVGWPIHSVEEVNGQPFDMAKRFFFAMGGYF
ncbi:MAG: outer membrane protein assembly factor BamA [Chlamydiales bacterium]|nr:outer membrane protein assembly factor BamA [Chlamydiales bacterium]